MKTNQEGGVDKGFEDKESTIPRQDKGKGKAIFDDRTALAGVGVHMVDDTTAEDVKELYGDSS